MQRVYHFLLLAQPRLSFVLYLVYLISKLRFQAVILFLQLSYLSVLLVNSFIQLPHLSCLLLLFLLEEGYLFEGDIVVSRSVVLECCLAPRLNIPVRGAWINNVGVFVVSRLVAKAQIPYWALTLARILVYVSSPVAFV